jgi:pimeloyl-ACP methyl ester carboxylesterase
MSRIRVGELDVNFQRLQPVAPADTEVPIVVFIHGLLFDSLASYYFTLGPAFAEQGMDVLMYDLRGHGRTTRLDSGYQLEEFIGDLAGLLDALDITRPVHLVGNSFGGTIAFGFAAEHPHRVASVTSIESEPPVEAWAQRMREVLTASKAGFVHDNVVGWISDTDSAHTARLMKSAGKILQITTIAEDVPRSRTIADDLSAVRCPVYALFGGESGLSAWAEYLEAILCRCRTVVLPGQGHSVLVERTEEASRLILDWVQTGAAAVTESA